MPQLGTSALSLLVELELCDVREQLRHNLLHDILRFLNGGSCRFRRSTQFPAAERPRAAPRGDTGCGATLGHRLYRVSIVAFGLRWLGTIMKDEPGRQGGHVVIRPR